MITIFKIFEKFNDKSKNYSYTITELNDAIASNQYLKFLDILKNVSDKINTIDNPDQEWTPLLYAVNNNRIKMVKQLIKYGADVNHKSHMGNTALMLAANI